MRRISRPTCQEIHRPHRPSPLVAAAGTCVGLALAVRFAAATTYVNANASVHNTTGGELRTDQVRAISSADYDRDGDVDVFLSSGLQTVPEEPTLGKGYLLRNMLSETGSLVFERQGLSAFSEFPQFGSFGVALWGDYDNDGDLDLFTAHDPKQDPNASSLENRGTLFFENVVDANGAVLFVERGIAAGLQSPVTSDGWEAFIESAAWWDFDNDGWLDLFVANATGQQGFAWANQLFRNNGDRTFTDITGQTQVDEVTGRTLAYPIESTSKGFGVSAADFDNDGDAELFVCRRWGDPGSFLRCGPNEDQLFRYDGFTGGLYRFTNIAAAQGVNDPANGYGSAWGDVNNDGKLDLVIANNASSQEPCLSLAGPRLYQQVAGGGFVRQTFPPGDTGSTDSSQYLDFDLDGDLDIVTTWTFQDIYGVDIGGLYRNDGGGAWVKDPGGNAALELRQNQTNQTVADFDNDGDLDVFTGGFWEPPDPLGRGFTLALNDGVGLSARHRLKVRLIGSITAPGQTPVVNGAAIGSKVKITPNLAQPGVFQVREISGGSGDGSQVEPAAYFGFGDLSARPQVDEVRVTWLGRDSNPGLPGIQPYETVVGPIPVTTGFQEIVIPFEQQAPVFQNESVTAGLSYQGTPYSAVPLDYDGDGKLDLMVSLAGARAKLFRKIGELLGVPVFQGDPQGAFDANEPQFDARGLTVADYDNDGDLDLFAAHATAPRLYRNGTGTPRFTDVTTSLGLGTLADSSWAAAWGDYDRDGWLDLYVVRASGNPTPTGIVAEQGRLFCSQAGSGGGFVDVTASVGLPTSGAPSVAASWNDVDGNGELDLLVAYLAPADVPNGVWTKLYMNQGPASPRFVEDSTPRIYRLGFVSGVAWPDVNNDGVPDLAYSRQKTSGTFVLNNAMVFVNDGTGHFAQWTSGKGIFTRRPLLSLLPFDHDFDGHVDFLGVPQNAEPPVLFASARNATGVTYVDRGAVAQWSPSTGRRSPLDYEAAQGAVLTDYNLDGDNDLFLGRTYNAQSPRNYYQNKGTTAADPPTQHWVGIRLRAPDIGNNRAGIGARVKVEAPGVNPTLVQAQVVDGGIGRGLQGGPALIFGLGGQLSSIKATVTWSDGYVQSMTIPSNQLDQVHEIVDDHSPTLVTGSMTIGYTPKPGGLMDITVRWSCSRSSNPASDRVIFTSTSGPTCLQLPITLTPSTPGVVATVVPKVGGGYEHTMTWLDQPCVAPCTYNLYAKSSYGGRDAVTATKTLSIFSCVQ